MQDKIIKNLNQQPQPWQALWANCGMPQPASEFKVELEKMEKADTIGIRRIQGNKYYYKKGG